MELLKSRDEAVAQAKVTIITNLHRDALNTPAVRARGSRETQRGRPWSPDVKCDSHVLGMNVFISAKSLSNRKSSLLGYASNRLRAKRR